MNSLDVLGPPGYSFWMELIKGDQALEELNQELNDPEHLAAYKGRYDDYRVSFIPKILGGFLVGCGNIVYGNEPSYLKFRAVEVIARVPYHSWASAAYTLLTLFYTNEHKAVWLSDVARYARFAQDNETMHVVVMSHCARDCGEKAGTIRHTVIPMLFAFFYFWTSYLLYFINPRYSYELNFMFEGHAFGQYDRFLVLKGESLIQKPIKSEFLEWYGRTVANEYELIRSIRNDEIIHRNSSIEEIEMLPKKKQ